MKQENSQRIVCLKSALLINFGKIFLFFKMAANDNRTVFDMQGGPDVIYKMLMDVPGKDLIDIYHKYPNTRPILETDSFWKGKIAKDFGIGPETINSAAPRLYKISHIRKFMNSSESNPYRLFYYMLTQLYKDNDSPDNVNLLIYSLANNKEKFYELAKKLFAKDHQNIFGILFDAILTGDLDVVKEVYNRYKLVNFGSYQNSKNTSILYQAYISSPEIFNYLITKIPVTIDLMDMAIKKENIPLIRDIMPFIPNHNLDGLLKIAAKYGKEKAIDFFLS